MTVRVTSAAQADLAKALRWYRRQAGLDHRFLRAFDTALGLLDKQPKSLQSSKTRCAGISYQAFHTRSSTSSEAMTSLSLDVSMERGTRISGVTEDPKSTTRPFAPGALLVHRLSSPNEEDLIRDLAVLSSTM